MAENIIYDLVDRCFINAYILEYESPNHTKRPLKPFRADLIRQLIGDFTSRKATGRRSLELLSSFTEMHFPSSLPTNEEGVRIQRRVISARTSRPTGVTTMMLVSVQEHASGFITHDPEFFCKQIVLWFQCCPNIAKSLFYYEKNFNVLPRGTFINISILDKK